MKQTISMLKKLLWSENICDFETSITLSLRIQLNHQITIMILSLICLPATKALCVSKIIIDRIFFKLNGEKLWDDLIQNIVKTNESEMRH